MESRKQRDTSRPLRIRTPAALPTGPRLYKEPKHGGYVGPVTAPPPGFIGPWNSRTEWMVYHAIARVIGQPEDPRQPPFIGAPGLWKYQKVWDEGRAQAGGSVIDFVVFAGPRSSDDVAFRIQTEYFHVFGTAKQQITDALQYERLSQYMRVVDLFDQDFAFDDTNQACIILVKEALAGNTFPDPIVAGTAQRVSRMG